MKNENFKTISYNKKAAHDYFILESLEAGIALLGTEVKSVRKGNVSIKDAWCGFAKNEIFVHGMHIGKYEQGNNFNADPLRVRKLLVHKYEIAKLFGAVKLQGYSVIPISIYLKKSNIKLQIGLCKGKKLYDKREDIAKKTVKREIEREFKGKTNNNW
jgi:SsrA-binding protein